MKTPVIALSLLVLALAGAGCATNAVKMNQVRIGMPKNDVVALLGEPDSVIGNANAEYLTYYLDQSSRTRGQPYMIKLADGRIESFGRFIQLLDVYERPAPRGSGAMAAIVPYQVNTDKVTVLYQLQALRDQGVLTEEEFKRAKERLEKAQS